MKINRSQAKKAIRLNINKSLASINCLVTGYDAFEHHTYNPSELIVNACPDEVMLSDAKTRVSLQRLVMPVCGERAWPKLKKLLNRMSMNKKPCLIIMFGLAAVRTNVELERFALNIRDGNRKDNYGHVYHGEVVQAHAPDAIRTKAPIEKAIVYLKGKGFPAQISNFANTYVCNEVYFQALNYFEKSRTKHCLSFVHLPLPNTYGKTLQEHGSKKTLHFAKGKKNQLEAMRLILLALVEFYSEYLLG